VPNINKPNDINNIWAATGDIAAPDAAYVANGWEAIIPPREYFNWLDNKQDRFNAHVNQHGIPVWDNATEYQASLSYTKGSNGTLYRAVRTNSNVNPVTDTTGAWTTAFGVSSAGMMRFISSGYFVVPAGKTTIYISGVAGGGGGGAGGGSAASGSLGRIGANAGGGGAGQSIIKVPFTVVPGSTLAVVIGAGGSGFQGTFTTGPNGQAGGDTKVGTFLTLDGGNGGLGGPNVNNGSGGGVLGGTGYPNGGGGSDASGSIGDDNAGSGGAGGNGASSPFGGGGAGGRGTKSNGDPGVNAGQFGAGGGGGGGCYRVNGSNRGGTGGNGSGGLIIIEWY